MAMLWFQEQLDLRDACAFERRLRARLCVPTRWVEQRMPPVRSKNENYRHLPGFILTGSNGANPGTLVSVKIRNLSRLRIGCGQLLPEARLAMNRRVIEEFQIVERFRRVTVGYASERPLIVTDHASKLALTAVRPPVRFAALAPSDHSEFFANR